MKDNCQIKTIPQSPTATAPLYTKGPPLCFIYFSVGEGLAPPVFIFLRLFDISYVGGLEVIVFCL